VGRYCRSCSLGVEWCRWVVVPYDARVGEYGGVCGGARVDKVRCSCGVALCQLRFVLVHLLCVHSEKLTGVCRRLLQSESSSRPHSRCSHVKS